MSLTLLMLEKGATAPEVTGALLRRRLLTQLGEKIDVGACGKGGQGHVMAPAELNDFVMEVHRVFDGGAVLFLRGIPTRAALVRCASSHTFHKFIFLDF